jgi:hypothetical protein
MKYEKSQYTRLTYFKTNEQTYCTLIHTVLVVIMYTAFCKTTTYISFTFASVQLTHPSPTAHTATETLVFATEQLTPYQFYNLL